MLDLYSPGTSVLHRLSPGVKMLSMALGATLLFLNQSLLITAAATLGILALYPVARLPLTKAAAQLRPLLVIFALFFAVQWYFESLTLAAYVVLRLAALILLASLVTLTTRSSDMIDTMTRGLRHLKPLGVHPEKVSLAISLALRFIPVLAQITTEVREAQKVRGLERSVIAVAMPMAIRAIKIADDISDAIDSRGYRS
ncbi:energy-coupling factor transporter transmembrane component T family protein [Shimia marina]|uniref:Energy-coupling factor transporter transmembrane protein BioN n=1 Tax=Shimia marina TaxID=321267 RepID=A0A0N7LSM2_9RHOB|nr:energy-coupling factor transporter transmembrane protein EcfT [Shimia marina]CUH54012.1 Energy-coupling factor transporter transmembrane protein BioN [Shimia marina]SFE16915.1 biotin transport system permease protein [Shimia marina]